MVEVPLEGGAVDVVLRHPLEPVDAGHWSFVRGGTVLGIDLLAVGTSMCTVDGVAADSAHLDDGFIAWPRMTFVVNGRSIEVVTDDGRVLRRHYDRPRHQEEVYVPGIADPYVETYHAARIAQLRRLLTGLRGRLLDAGSGYSLVAMAGPWTQLEVVACDRDGGAVRNLRAAGNPRALIASAERLPFAPGSFDVVFAGEIVEHLLEPDRALREWVGALRPGGRLILTTPNRMHIIARLTKAFQPKNPEHLFEYSRRELIAAVEGTGARVDHVEGLQLAMPVWVPGLGWRDAVAGVRRRWRVPGWVDRVSVRAGRWLPGLAENLAVVATRR